jgi:hypothetical protein
MPENIGFKGKIIQKQFITQVLMADELIIIL